jgi:uncharacterized BrkB/YihY/UPF0761 family membrane protein
MDDLQRRRSTNRLISTVFDSVEHENRVGGGLLAGAVAFRVFFVLVPYVFVLVIGVGLGSELAGQDAQDVARTLGIAGLVASSVTAAMGASLLTRIVTFCVALYALMSGSRNLMKALRTVHALVWQVPLTKMRRPMVAALGFLGAMTVGLTIVRMIAGLRSISLIMWLLSTILFMALPAGAWLLTMLKLFPSAPGTTWKDLWIGALLMGAGVEVLHVVTVYWIARSLESKSSTYGALGAALTILLWAYMLGRLVTASASLNAAIWNSKERS